MPRRLAHERSHRNDYPEDPEALDANSLRAGDEPVEKLVDDHADHESDDAGAGNDGVIPGIPSAPET